MIWVPILVPITVPLLSPTATFDWTRGSTEPAEPPPLLVTVFCPVGADGRVSPAVVDGSSRDARHSRISTSWTMTPSGTHESQRYCLQSAGSISGSTPVATLVS